MNPDEVILEDLSKNFEYFKISAQIDNITDIEEAKTLAKCYFKLYLKQQEVISKF
jgi:hypothetical protein